MKRLVRERPQPPTNRPKAPGTSIRAACKPNAHEAVGDRRSRKEKQFAAKHLGMCAKVEHALRAGGLYNRPSNSRC